MKKTLKLGAVIAASLITTVSAFAGWSGVIQDELLRVLPTLKGGADA